MGLRISTNIASMGAQRALKNTTDDLSKIYHRLSSGKRIVSAGDDAAGLSLSENMRAQIRSLSQAERNAQDGISFAQVAEGGLNEIGNILVRVRELSIQAASDTVGNREREMIDLEVQSLVGEMDRIANATTFNGTPLLNAQAEKGELEFQVGIRNEEADRITFNAADTDVRADNIGVSGVNTLSIEDARESLGVVDEALITVNQNRAKLGAMQNKLRSTSNNLAIEKENLSAARSRIADTDMAAETSELVKRNILQTAGVSVLAQANQVPTQALKLV